MSFSVGSLVKARGREWVVLPDSEPEDHLVVLRPLGGSDEEVAGIDLRLEEVESAEFSLPDPKQLGSHLSCGLLRDAVRLGFRSGTGPFRSLARIAVEPRPYQLVPLLMALRTEPIRILIADDVGIGKTIEACLIARELLDRGEIQRITVLCPPHLAKQWQRAMREQFHIDAALVLPGTAARLERDCVGSESLFDRYPHTIISMDYIKSEKRRFELLRAAPEFVIVDEAHTCAIAEGQRSTRHRRHELLREVIEKHQPHLVLVTATPHSGNEHTFRSLLGLLEPQLRDLPEDLSGDTNRKHREQLAQYLVQRRRADLEDYLDIQTPFPKREIAEEHYTLSKDYRKLLDRVLAYCRERVVQPGLKEHQQRVQWWSALALLRALSSSPPAAAATLRTRASSADTLSVREADDVGRRTVLDTDEDSFEGMDIVPGSQGEGEEAASKPASDRLRKLAKEVEKLAGKKDAKLQRAGELVEKLVKDGHAPIVFCRFIPTVDYVAAHLRKRLGKNVKVEAITGTLPPSDRERRIEELGGHPKRVLVCTDCLSEGIDLQDSFDAVMHYDLSWNPTRHEQREGRVDRYGQRKKKVRTLTFYGQDNPVDGIVLQVLLRKHKAIHKKLGIIVPIPTDTNTVVEAIFEGLLLRENAGIEQISFDFLQPTREEVDIQWDAAVEREKKSRSLFAQRTIRVEEVALELAATRKALGDETAVEEFTTSSLKAMSVTVSGTRATKIDLTGTPAALRDAVDQEGQLETVFHTPVPRGAELLTRTHPFVEGLGAYVLESALDDLVDGPAKRCGVVRTKAVAKRSTLMLLRLRYHLVTRQRDGQERELLAEDAALVGFRGSPGRADWLDEEAVEQIVRAKPDANTPPEAAEQQLRRILDGFDKLAPDIERIARERGKRLLEAHRRVRKAGKLGAKALRVDPHLPADVLGVFVYLPVAGGTT